MAKRDVLTVDFFPGKISFPTFTPEAYLKQTAEDMLHLLETPVSSSHPAPALAFRSPVLNAYAKLGDTLRCATPPVPTSPTPPQRVLDVFLPVAPQRVSVVLHSPVPPLLPKKLPPPKQPRSLPLAYDNISPRFCSHPLPRLQFAQFIQHDPTIANKMFNPITGHPETIDTLLHGPDSLLWTTSLTNKWARCAQGLSVNRPPKRQFAGNQIIFFIPPDQAPAGRKITCANFVCTMRLQAGKAEPHRMCMTVGGNRLNAYQDVRAPVVGITETKLHLNSTISNTKHGARYCTGDLKDFPWLNDEIFQYMCVHQKYFPSEILGTYNLSAEHFDSKGYAYLEIHKGMYGLKEASSILAYDQLKEHLALYSYTPICFTPGLWHHNTRRTTFTLAVDDFGNKSFCKAVKDHLFSALKDKYELIQNWSGNSYLGLTLD